MTQEFPASHPKPAREIPCLKALPQTPEDIDARAYLQANPDVHKSGMSAVQHFMLFGKTEGRLQYSNFSQIAELREDKLRRLEFRRPPLPEREYGLPLNFLTPQVISEFDIPEAPPISENRYGGPFIDEIARDARRLCLDVGAGLRASYAENIVNVDIYPSYTTDVLCVGEDLPFADDQFDYVICAAVLEHTRRPWDVAREICRVLKPGGRVLVDFPFLQGVHGFPHHYFNATPRGSISLFEEQCDIVTSTIEPANHPIYSIWWLLETWRNGLREADRVRFESLRVADILQLAPELHLSQGYCGNLGYEALRTIPAGSTLIAQKKSSSGEPKLSSPDDGGLATRKMLDEQIGALQAEIMAIRTSRSWRLTAPLRTAITFWHRYRLARRA